MAYFVTICIALNGVIFGSQAQQNEKQYSFSDEDLAFKLAAEAVLKVDFSKTTDSQIKEVGQSVCAQMKDQVLVNICQDKFRSNLTNYDCDSGSYWSFSSQKRAIAQICRFGASVAYAVDFKSLHNIQEVKKVLQDQLESQCSKYKNEVAVQFCKRGGFQAVYSQFRGCSGIPSVITTYDFEGHWNGGNMVPVAFPCTNSEYGVSGFNYKVEMRATGAAVVLVKIKLSDNRIVYPKMPLSIVEVMYGGRSPFFYEQTFPEYAMICHEIEFEINKIVCTRNGYVMIYKIPANPSEIPAIDFIKPMCPDRSLEYCIF